MQQPPLTTLPVDRQIHADPASKNPHPDDSAALDARLVHETLADALTLGFQVEFDPAEADIAGAFDEDALSESDALASMHDAAPSPGSPATAPLPADRGRAGP